MKDTVESLIQEYVLGYAKRHGSETEWGVPLVAYADAMDPLFWLLPQVASPNHRMPSDFSQAAKVVITYFIPFDIKVARTNLLQADSSAAWAVAYVETKQLISDLDRYVAECLRGFGVLAMPCSYRFDGRQLVGDWSHRHAAYIAGLGTFGLNNMLITKAGCCGRVGSLVTDMEIPPSRRPDFEYCLYKREGTCGRCVERCPAGALKSNGFERYVCNQVLRNNSELHRDIGEADVCGKCVCGVPCSHGIPE